MPVFELKRTVAQREQRHTMLTIAQKLGRQQQATRVLAVLASSVGRAQTADTVASVLQVSTEAVCQWVSLFLAQGLVSSPVELYRH